MLEYSGEATKRHGEREAEFEGPHKVRRKAEASDASDDVDGTTIGGERGFAPMVTKVEVDNHPGSAYDGLEVVTGAPAYQVIEIGDVSEPSGFAVKKPQAPLGGAKNAEFSEMTISSILALDTYLSTPDREYLTCFFDHLGVHRTSDLLDIDALEPVQQYLRKALQQYELNNGSAGGSVRSALGRLVRDLIPEDVEKPQVKTEASPKPQASRKPSAVRVARVSQKTWTNRRLPGSAMPTICPVQVKRRYQAPSKPALVGLTIRAQNLKDKKGNCLPEVRWVVDGQQRVGEVVRRWGLDVLKLPENKLPGGVQGGIPELVDKGVVAHGQAGVIPLDARLAKVVDTLEVINGNRLISIQWPLISLPKDWGVVKDSKKQKKDKHCPDCGEVLTFRRCGNEEGIKTFAICSGCDRVKGCFMIKRNQN